MRLRDDETFTSVIPFSHDIYQSNGDKSIDVSVQVFKSSERNCNFNPFSVRRDIKHGNVMRQLRGFLSIFEWWPLEKHDSVVVLMAFDSFLIEKWLKDSNRLISRVPCLAGVWWQTTWWCWITVWNESLARPHPPFKRVIYSYRHFWYGIQYSSRNLIKS